MVTSLQQRVALFALVGVLLIPLLATNLRGLTHLLTCSEGVEQPFAITGLGDDEPSITSSTTLERGDDAGSAPAGAADDLLCDALRVQLSATGDGADRVLLEVAVSNDSDLPWRGTLDLAAQGDSVRIDSGLTARIGEVAPGETARTTLSLRVPPGQTDLSGTLLLGP